MLRPLALCPVVVAVAVLVPTAVPIAVVTDVVALAVAVAVVVAVAAVVVLVVMVAAAVAVPVAVETSSGALVLGLVGGRSLLNAADVREPPTENGLPEIGEFHPFPEGPYRGGLDLHPIDKDAHVSMTVEGLLVGVKTTRAIVTPIRHDSNLRLSMSVRA